MSKVLVAMSGGVDSSVTAFLLKDEGNECCGCTMKLYDTEDLANDGYDISCGLASKTCCSLDDVEDARSVAFKLGMPFHVLNFKDDFNECVIKDFVDNYRCGQTPNPCIRCNKYMKFDKLLLKAKTLGYDHIATGHYARIEYFDGEYHLRKAVDLTKDQSYVLYNLSQEQLASIYFPLGGFEKSQVREIAEQEGFVNARKHDSQDICFVPDGDYASMIERYTGETFPEGDFVDTKGNVIGRHKGIIHYTIGQRRGLGISSSGRIYVTGIDAKNNTVIIGSDDDLYNRTVKIRDFHFISSKEIPESIKCSAKIRYRMNEEPCVFTYEGDGKGTITYDEPQRAATPGQTAVLYDGEYVIGGGIIY